MNKEVDLFVTCEAVNPAESSLKRCCGDLADASAWDHVSHYPVESQTSVVKERVSLGKPVSLKTVELNKSLADRASKQEIGSQLNPTSINQLEKQRGTKNVTFHLPVGLSGKQKGRQTESRSQITVIPFLLLLPLSQPPPTDQHAEEVCHPLTQAAKTYLTNCIYTKSNLAISHAGHLLLKTSAVSSCPTLLPVCAGYSVAEILSDYNTSDL